MHDGTDQNQGELICGTPRHEAIKRDPEKVRMLTEPSRPQPDGAGGFVYLRRCITCGSTIAISRKIAAELAYTD